MNMPAIERPRRVSSKKIYFCHVFFVKYIYRQFFIKHYKNKIKYLVFF